MRYEADPGERNDVRVALTDAGFRLSDAGADIRAPADGCTSITPQLVSCAPTPSAPIVRIDILGGDGDDRIDASALVFTPTLLEAGAGDDVVVGGGTRDTLTGGPGSDVLDGRGGDDIASYADRGEDAGIRADLHEGSATGAGGERDALSNVEALRGGPGDDVLIGDGAENSLTGGGGSDELRGRGGDDLLTGAGALYGDAGDDRLLLKGSGRAVCGAGSADRVAASGSARVVDDSCESLRLPAVTVRLHLAHDPAKARLTFDLIDLPGRVLEARLTTTAAKPRLLGSLRHRIPSTAPRGRASLRLSASGAAYVRRSAPRDVLLTLRGRAKVRLHINRH